MTTTKNTSVLLIDPYQRAMGGGVISTRLASIIDDFKAEYQRKHGACEWAYISTTIGTALHPVLTDSQKSEVKAIEARTLASFERDAAKGFTID